MKHRLLFAIPTIVGVGAAACHRDDSSAPAAPPAAATSATAPILPAASRAPADLALVRAARVRMRPVGASGATGTLTLVLQEHDAGVRFSGQVTGLKPGSHGIHVHEVGNCDSPDGMAAGGHFNPTMAPHGSVDAAGSHLGDLGNVLADANGVANVDVTKLAARLGGPSSIMGRAIIVHAEADDLRAQPAGNAGARVSCGVIERP